ncbi:flavin reductase [Acetobacter oeni]|uniref:Flavin reductase n=1 Tax=Acetobacter oeni TaxID=304077 RepID=A0A511XME1_9PROT|nr:flavin reductase [Acetobacter oeni]MBB3883687.1 flavin reductase [Acetobacter oeni]NHO19732.1 flavin reductase [Acetobacter oeni]GBR02865.1 flavin mononucleotide reductase [Acetobacter oeni LMG 21952]GEN64114.1 flavin reductase [Acetobacter oeni]
MQPETLADLTRPPVATDLFREAMSRLGAPVTLVTTDGPAGRQGLTVSAITSVSDAPPTVLVCLNRSNRSHETFLQNGVVGISILGAPHNALAGIFASSRRSADEKFATGRWRTGQTGAPLLDDAVVTLDCTISDIHSSGSHDVLFCIVEAIGLHDAPEAGLAWFGRNFHHLPLSGSATQ